MFPGQDSVRSVPSLFWLADSRGETSSYGVILNESVRTGLPVSFLGTGPGIPDDLEPATPDRIVDYLLEGRESRAVAAA